jgi:hypothetical protein
MSDFFYFTFSGAKINKSYFMDNKMKSFALFDFPLLIKSMRNTVLDNEQLNTSDGIMSWRVIKEFNYLEKWFASKMATKLNDIHVHPNSFKKMQVSYATHLHLASKHCIA